MKILISFVIIFSWTIKADAQTVYRPVNYFGHAAQIQIPGESVDHPDGTRELTIRETITPVSYYYLQDVIRKQDSMGIKVKYDMGLPEEYFLSESSAFLVFVKGNNAITLFNNNDTSYIVTKHPLFHGSVDTIGGEACAYGSIFSNPNCISKSDLTFKQIKAKLKARDIILLTQENLKLVFATL